jgi:hypothetical protein
MNFASAPPPSQGERCYHCALPVTLRRRGEDRELLTSEVSFREAFIRTTDAPPQNSLVRLVFTLPPDDAKIALSSHVTRVVAAGSGEEHYPGFAARFVGLDGPVKERWENLVFTLRREHQDSGATTVTFARPSYVARFQLKAPVADDIRVTPSSVEDLTRIVNEDIPSGTLFIATRTSVVLGANVCVKLVHPITQDVFPLEGVVRRRGAGAEPGVLVGLARLSMDVRVGLQELVNSVVVVEDYDVELYEEPSVKRR